MRCKFVGTEEQYPSQSANLCIHHRFSLSMSSTLFEFAQESDRNDAFAPFRSLFAGPQHKGQSAVYLCGNSLGLLPKAAQNRVQQEFQDWAEHGVEGHFRAKEPWFGYHHQFRASLARLVGAREQEVVCMNSLSVNVHLMLASFYQPTAERRRILILANEFPSDRYAVESQVRLHHGDPAVDIVELRPREGEDLLRTEDVLRTIAELGSSLALMHCSAVHYYTGQFFDMARWTKAAQDVGALVGWDLAHAIGNVPLRLHEWNVDYAAWCSYKYLNSGPGGVGGVFVHSRHCEDATRLRLAGWWGNDESTRFTMPQWFSPVPSAESWQLSNAPVFSMAIHRAALDVFDQIHMEELSAKGRALSSYLIRVIDTLAQEFPADALRVISPRNDAERGAQVSTIATRNGRQLFDYLAANGVIADWRNPDVIRMAPAPLYCSFSDIYRLYECIRNYCLEQR